jgi:predicted site-specific integrase-resolvase
MNNDGALSEPQAARVLSVHLSTLRRWRKKGAVGYTLTPGGRIRYSPADLARLAAAMHVAPTLGRV